MSDKNNTPQTYGDYLGVHTLEDLLQNITWGEFTDLLEAADKGDEELEKTVQTLLAYRLEQQLMSAQEVQEHTQEPGKIITERPRKKHPQEEIDPELLAQANKVIEQCGGIEGFKARLEQREAEFAQEISKGIGSAIKEIAPDLREIYRGMMKAVEAAIEFIHSDAYKAITATAAAIASWHDENPEAIKQLSAGAKQVYDLLPFIEAELQEWKKKHPELAEASTDDVLVCFYDDGTPIEDSPFYELIENARAHKAEYEKGLAIAEQAERIIAHPVENVHWPLDKASITDLWATVAEAPADGQLKMTGYKTGKKAAKGKKQEEAIVLCAVTWPNDENIRITKKLTPFDEMIYSIVDGLKRSGNNCFSITQIYKVMNEGRTPKSADVQRIDESLTKMGYARIYINNEQEAQTTHYPQISIDAPLLSFKRITARVNGKLSEGLIQVIDNLPLMEFARGRKQITTFPARLLAAPVNKTEKALKIQKYLLDRIGRMKGSRAATVPTKILYSTLFDRCGISDSKPERTKNTIKRYLDHYKKCGWIKGYTESADGVTVQP